MYLTFKKIVTLISIIMLLVPLNSIIGVSAGTTVYDFISSAADAQWSSGAGALPFPGDPSDSRGFARHVYNARLEDGLVWSRVLETHPQWVSGGWIMGVYPQQTVPSNTQLTVRVGFLHGAAGTDGVRFEVYFDEYRGVGAAPQRHVILRKAATLDGSLDLVTVDLDFIAGKRGSFILYVYALKTSNRDWAVWAEARIEAKPRPDLVVTDVWESGGLIHYKVKNIGDDLTKTGFCNSLSINGQGVAEHCITRALHPGQEVEGVFDYAWQPTPGVHVVKVCADSRRSIQESNEGNNCLEEKWKMEDFPDLIIAEVKFDPQSRLVGYVLKNVGKEAARRGHSTTLYVNQREAAHDPVNIDLPSGGVYESWFRDYKISGDTSIRVKVCADNYNQVKESDEGNNCMESILDASPPIVTLTYSPATVTTRDRVTFSAAATDDVGVTRILIYLNKAMVKECAPPIRNPQDGKYYCTYEEGPFDEGVLLVIVEAFDPSGNKGVYEEQIHIRSPPPPPPPIQQCQISGKIYGFPYNRDTLKIKVCEAEQVCSHSFNPITGERTLSCSIQCKMVWQEILGGWAYSWVEYADVRFVWEFQPYEYSILVPCTGEYLLEPVYHPCPDPAAPTPECQCPWRGTWDASKGSHVRMDGRSQEGYDFTFRPIDTTIPSVTITFSNEHPRIGEEVEVIVEVRDAVEIKYVDLTVFNIVYTDGSRGRPTVYKFFKDEFTQYYFDSARGVYVAVVRWRIPWNNIYEIAFEATACDDCGNWRIAPLKRLKFAGCPVINFDFGDSGGRVMRSDFPIFGLPDKDDDTINDCWEVQAMEAVKPYIEMDEEEQLDEDWYLHKVTFFVRVTPYNPYNPDYNRTNPTHILFFFVTTWSDDFGRLGFEAHPGDTEPFVMAWRIGEDRRTLYLEYVYIEAHGDCNKRHDLWSPWGTTYNTAPFCINRFDVVVGRDYQTLAGSLNFKDNRLYLYASEDKHALYPSCSVCENVWLVCFACEAGLACFNSVGDFGLCLLDGLRIFWNLLVWSVTELPLAILTGGLSLIIPWITNALEDDYRGTQPAVWSYPSLLDIVGDSTHGSTTQRLDFDGDDFHYWVEYSVEVDVKEPYSRERPHVRITVLRIHVDDEAWDMGCHPGLCSEEINMVVTGFSVHPGGVNVWRVLECRDGDADGGESEWLWDHLGKGKDTNWCTRTSTDVVFEGEVEESYAIGLVVTLSEDDGEETDLNDMGDDWKQGVEEMLRQLVEFPTCEEETLTIMGATYLLIGEDCGCRKRWRGSEPILLNAYNVGEPQKLMLYALWTPIYESYPQTDLGGRGLRDEDSYFNEWIVGKTVICEGKPTRKFCGGHNIWSCECASPILSFMYDAPKKLKCAYTPEDPRCREED